MTSGCEFHSGNRRLAQIDWGTVSGAIRWLELPFTNQILRPQRKRTRRSTVRSWWEGRASSHYAKASIASSGCLPVACEYAASPVLQGWHEEKVIGTNLGDRAVFADALVTVRASTVVLPISSKSEMVAEALHGVGEAHMIHDCEDSITSRERRSLTCVHDCSNFMDESIPKGKR
jgi:hypothetical protein